MITELAQEQWDKVPQYLNKWLKVGYRTDPIDQERAKEAVNFLYRDILKIDLPKYYIFLDSPIQCNLAINLLKGSQLHSQLYLQLDSQLNSQLDSQLRSQLRSELGSQLGSQLRSQLDSQLRSQLDSQLGLQLDSQLGSQLDSQLYSRLGSQLYSQLDSQLCSQLRSRNLKMYHDSRSNWWNNYYWHYDFILNEVFPEKKKEFSLYEQYIEHSKHYHLVYMFNGMVFISDFPKEIVLNGDNQLHNEKDSALRYRDNYVLHSLFGVRVEKEMLTYDATQIMAVKNAEQRLVLIKNYGIENMLDQLDSKIIDEFKEYKLHSVLLEGEREMLLEMQNPSEPKKHFEFVPPEMDTCQKAMAWRFGLDLYVNPAFEA